MSILGNPITLGGGGADLNIDFGSTPPADTSKLWVPLASKPSKVTNSYSLMVQDWTNSSYAASSGDIYTDCAICKYGNGWYLFGGQVSSATGGLTNSTQAKRVHYFDKTTRAISLVASDLPLLVGAAPCIVKNGWIYIFGALSNTSTYGWGGENNIIRFNPSTKVSEIVYRGSTTAPTGSNGGVWANAKLVAIDADNILICPSGGDYNSQTLYKYTFSTNSVVQLGNRNIGHYQCHWYARTENEIFSQTYQQKPAKYNFITGTVGEFSPISYDGYNSVSPIIWIGGESYWLAENSIYKFVNQNSAVSISSLIYAFSVFQGQNIRSFANYDYQNQIITWYNPSSNTIYELAAKSHLDEGTLYINCDFGQKEVLFVSDKDNKIYINPLSVYLGDNNSIAQKVDAYLYDEESSTWKTLDGTSYTADMLSALNIMGVT